MRLVVTEFLSLDGVMEDPKWTAPYWNDTIAKFKFEELLATDAHLLGRVTYQGFAEAWPTREDEAGFADRMNSIPKHVVTTTLDTLDWNNSHVVKGDVPKEIGKLKERPGGDLLVAGSATLVQTLVAHDLVDEYRLLTYPVMVGSGKHLFTDITEQVKLKLVSATPMEKGVVLLVYEPDRE